MNGIERDPWNEERGVALVGGDPYRAAVAAIEALRSEIGNLKAEIAGRDVRIASLQKDVERLEIEVAIRDGVLSGLMDQVGRIIDLLPKPESANEGKSNILPFPAKPPRADSAGH